MPTAVRVKPAGEFDSNMHFTVYTSCTDKDMEIFTLRTHNIHITGQMILEKYITAVNSKKRSFDFEAIVKSIEKELEKDEL